MLLQAPITTGQLEVLPFDMQILLLLFVKILLVVGAVLYLVFSFVVVRQIHVMRSTVITPFSNFIQLLGFIHLLFALGVLILFTVIL